jgi:hypothetical protein
MSATSSLLKAISAVLTNSEGLRLNPAFRYAAYELAAQATGNNRDYGASLLNPRLATRRWKMGTPFGQRLQQASRRHRWRDRRLLRNKK